MTVLLAQVRTAPCMGVGATSAASGCGTPGTRGTVTYPDVSARAADWLWSTFTGEGESGWHFAAAAPEDLCLSKTQ